MPTETFHLAPRDLLFLRDARPMGAADAGLGANWPRPDQVWSALIHAFHREWPELQPWEHLHHKRDGENRLSSDRFGGLKTIGPFPYATADGEMSGNGLFRAGLHLPCPLDLSADGNGTLHPMRLVSGDGSNLPPPLELAFSSSCIGKAALPAWLHAEDFAAYLTGAPVQPETDPQLFDEERNIGIAIAPETHATVKGMFYQAEYLRLRDGVRLALAASCDLVGANRQQVDVLAKLPRHGFDLIAGGQQGVARAVRSPEPLGLPGTETSGDSLLVKWVLLAPAVFPAIPANPEKGVPCHPGGWLPTWVDPGTGQVLLPRRAPERQGGESRVAWRRRIAAAPPFAARLVAARVGKPLPFSGWDLRKGSPKPTLLAIPAGSVYVFRCGDIEERDALMRALQWNGGEGGEPCNRRSGVHGEKGFGIGICTTCNQ
jgi:CRISPR-associated protein Cmr3